MNSGANSFAAAAAVLASVDSCCDDPAVVSFLKPTVGRGVAR